MFDTSLVRTHTVAAPRRLSLFAISIALHTAVAIAAISATVASVDFPKAAPDQIEVYRPVNPPPPLGTPTGGRPKIAPTPPKNREVVKQPQTITQPQAIPEETPLPDQTMDSASTALGEDTGAGPETGSGEGSFGFPDGKEGGIGDGPGGEGILPGSGPLMPGGEVRPARVLRRVEPLYPPVMQRVGFRTAVVVVRCVIDKQGKIRDPQIIHTTHGGFNNSVLEAVREWTFVPGTLRGEPVDTWFELTVSFKMR